jgi:FkbM family methyltransferase
MRNFFFNKINKYFELLSRNIVLCDVGARGGLEKPWLSHSNSISVVGFEPDKKEYHELNHNKNKNDIILPYALYNKESALSLNLTNSRGCSSIYLPNYQFLDRFPDSKRFSVEEKCPIETTTLDKLHENKKIENIDFIKLDTQGSELEILKGGSKFLNNSIIGLQVEVEFKTMYESQPLFSDVDKYIRDEFRLELFDIRKTYWKYNEGKGIGQKKGQLIFGDALYLRDPYDFPKWCEQFEAKEARNKIITACFVGIMYGYIDYSLCILEQSGISNWMSIETIEKLKTITIINAVHNQVSFKGSGKIWRILNLITKLFEIDHEGWANIEPHLGSRKMFGVFH